MPNKLSQLPGVNLKLIIQYSYDDIWDWGTDGLSIHPNLTIEWVKAFPDKPWDWGINGLSIHPNFKIKWLKAFPDKPWSKIYETSAIKIQSWFRGCVFRFKRLPLIMYQIQKYMKKQSFIFSSQNEDGRINSILDEPNIISLLIERFDNRIKRTPNKKKNIRMWYDMLAFDYICGWIPINIKTTTTTTSDNTGNLAMCVYAYTDHILDLDNYYTNGNLHIILFDKLRNKEYNRNNKKDYYFLVCDKTNSSNIIINSIKGLTKLTPNNNNLPFQVRWDKNKEYKYQHINNNINQFIDCIQKPKPSWSELFQANIRKL